MNNLPCRNCKHNVEQPGVLSPLCDCCLHYGINNAGVNNYKEKTFSKTFDLIDSQINPERNKIEIIEIWKNGCLIAYIEDNNIKYLKNNYLIEKSYKYK